MIKAEDNGVSVFFVRHGSTKFNGDGNSPDRIRGWIDVPLNKDGEKEAKEAAKELKDKDIKVIYASDLKRTHQTAQALEDKLGIKMQVTYNLRPWNLGQLQGEKTDDVRSEMNSYITERGKKKSPHGGESFDDFLQRYFGKLSKILDEAKETGQNIAIVTHYRNLKAAEAWLAAGMKGDDLDLKVFKEDNIKPGDIIEWRLKGGKWHQK
jgi:broad specificity phosphatase PhoE